MKSKVFDYREDEPHCLQCGHEKFTTIEWSEFDESVNFGNPLSNKYMRQSLSTHTATMISVGPILTNFRFKMCAKCGSLHKTYQPAEWKDKYILMGNTTGLMARYKYWRDK